jgi:hypothetical protein
MTLLKSSPKTIEEVSIKIATCFIAFLLLAVLSCPGRSHSREDSSKIEDLSKIDSGFFISKDDVYGLSDIYYYISDDAIAQIEQLEFKAHLMEFVTDPLERKVHIVQSGDSLWDIATKYRISVEELVHLNNMTTTAPIYPGQRLRVAPKSISAP